MSERISKIMRLINDPLFADFAEMQGEYSFFNVVGRTHTETWHSAFLGWLLNPTSSHGLGDYSLRRFIVLMMEKENLNARRKYSLIDILPHANVRDAVARPNEADPIEASVKTLIDNENKKGRIDVLVEGIQYKNTKVSIIVEMKVNDSISSSQCKKYVTYIDDQEKLYGKVIYPVYVTPTWNLGQRHEILFGSNQWIVLDFQDIYDEVVEPCLASKRLTDFGRYILHEYIKVLKFPNQKKGGRRMVITEKERELAYNLQEQYGDAIDMLFEILRPEEPSISIPNTKTGGKKSPIKIKIEEKTFEATSIPKLFEQVLQYLLDGHHIDNLELPVSTGNKRYLLATEPIHPTGRPFHAEISRGGYFMEAHKSRYEGLNDLFELLDKLKLSYVNLAPQNGE